MWTLIASMGVPLLKWIFSMIAKKKLSDKEFVDYIVASQKKKKRAGQASMDFDGSMSDAMKEAKAKKAAKEAAKVE